MAGLVAVVHLREAKDRALPRVLVVAVAILAIGAGITSMVQVYRIGDSGAQSVWNGVAAGEKHCAVTALLWVDRMPGHFVRADESRWKAGAGLGLRAAALGLAPADQASIKVDPQINNDGGEFDRRFRSTETVQMTGYRRE
ncbi:hypothetical protein AB0L82_31425 [Nocardia sp. NPDC052001]|uniref:hypothetical protein n=1 Tax=Nocardia sp. NPDC052001 TaxID=3154853 RepID=UPI0034199DFE